MTAAELWAWLRPMADVGALVPAAEVIARLELVPAAAAPRQLEDVPLDCAAVAAALSRTPAAVRAWCRAGAIPGAFRLNGREWRIPRAGLRALLEAPAHTRVQTSAAPSVPRPRRARSGLGSWRLER